MNTKDIVVVGLLSAILMSAQIILSFLPNIEIVSLLILIFAIKLGTRKTVCITLLYSALNVLIWGLNLSTIGYFFVWSGYAVICSKCKRFINKDITAAIFLGLFGLIFGALFAILYLPMGFSFAFSYWINGLMFDLIHCISNFIICIWAFSPLLSGFDKAMKTTYKRSYYI
ncbi:hypothetical protein [Romboutsia sp. 13368]|uniref:hypothetical protein n=1 Tax=Romboutsia sp. 13368 TaxID=2708053 RepID=UPI0025F035B6|nr:hypothetical protein [Romboutsia sp. 13368]